MCDWLGAEVCTAVRHQAYRVSLPKWAEIAAQSPKCSFLFTPHDQRFTRQVWSSKGRRRNGGSRAQRLWDVQEKDDGWKCEE